MPGVFWGQAGKITVEFPAMFRDYLLLKTPI